MRRVLLACAMAAGMFQPGTARCDFVDSEVGARALGMGGAFVAMSGDPSSLYWNPAALIAPEHRLQLSGMRTRLFDGVDDLNEDFLGFTAQAGRWAGGVGWTRTGVQDIYYEDVVTGAVAFSALPGLLDVGASVLFYGVDAPGYEAINDPNYLGAQWESSFSLGVMYHASPELKLAASFENLLRPEIQLVATSGDVEKIGGRRRFGASYLLQEVVYLTGEVRHNDVPEFVDEEITFHFGSEAWFNESFAMRLGLDSGDLTFGAGVAVNVVRVDLALRTHPRLGNTSRAAATLRF